VARHSPIENAAMLAESGMILIADANFFKHYKILHTMKLDQNTKEILELLIIPLTFFLLMALLILDLPSGLNLNF
jgi:hypothetical protein